MRKKDLRLKMKSVRSSLPVRRRQEANRELFFSLCNLVSQYSCVLSFHSVLSEISLDLVNQILCKNKQLILPTLSGGLYRVEHFQNTIKRSNQFVEPNPSKCVKISLDQIDCALVPALAFDKSYHRLGYGKGIYDRLLEKKKFYSIGVGFKEQLIEKLPVESHDQKLDELLLF